MEVVIFKIQVVDVQSGVVTLGSTPLVVPQFLGLSNAINSSMLTIKAAADRICTVRLMTSDTGVPSAGQLVREDNAPHRKGWFSVLHQRSVFLSKTAGNNVSLLMF